MKNKGTLTGQIDNTDLVNYPQGKVQNNDGSNNGTPVNDFTQSDVQEFFYKLCRLYDITLNDLFDNETNGYQTVEALIAVASKNDFVLDVTDDNGDLSIPVKLGKLLDGESIILKATIDKAAQTNLKGSLDSVTKPITFVGDFKTGEYIRMINNNTSVTLIRMVDFNNFDTVLREYLSVIPLMSGRINSDGTINQGDGFTCSKVSTGTYDITHNLNNGGLYMLTGTPHSSSHRLSAGTQGTFDQRVYITNNDGTNVDGAFNFVIHSMNAKL